MDSKKRSLSLDAVRGTAILMVMIFHYHELGLIPNPPAPFFPFLGMFGVDLFYVLSGFFITLSVLLAKTWNPGVFFKARFTRIYPAYLFSLPLFIAGKLYRGQLFDTYFFSSILVHLFMGHNLIPSVGGSINGTFWTLGVEFPYYMLMLAIGYFLRDLKLFWITTTLMLIICLIWRYAVYIYIPTDANRFFASTQLPGTLDAFAFGGIAAFFSTHQPFRHNLLLWRWPIFLTGFVLAVISLTYVTQHAGHYWSYGWTSVSWRSGLALSFALIIASCSVMQNSKILHYFGLPWLGKISFSLYIYHLLPGQVIKEIYSQLFWTWQLLIASMCSIIISWLSWRFIEIRFHRTNIPISIIKPNLQLPKQTL